MSKTIPRHLISLLTLLILIAAGGALAGFWSGEKPVGYETATVERGNLEKTVTALGSLRPRNLVNVGAQVSGQLTRVHVEVGDQVEAGQLLAEIDPRVYESQVQSSEANLERLKARLAENRAQVELAGLQLERNQNLLKSKAVSQHTVDESAAGLKIAEAQVRSLQAEIRAAESALRGDITNLGYTKIYAPMSGTVVAEVSLEGQTVNANQSAPEIVTIADLETMTVWAEVSEADVVKIEAGMPVYFTTLGMPERRWEGTVRQIQPTPQIVNDVVLYNVLVDVDNSEQLLMRDMTAQVFFIIEQVEDVVMAPVAALQRKGMHFEARVLTAQGPELRELKVGMTTRSMAEIISGLKLGEAIITGEARAGAPAAEERRRMPRF